MAEAVFSHLTSSNPLIGETDSCGTGAWHVGSSPDDRTMAVLRKHKITNYEHAARKVQMEDFFDFDWVLGMDTDNVDGLQRWRQRAVKKAMEEGRQAEGIARVGLFGDFGRLDKKGRGEEVIDPYYGDDDGFDIAYEQMGRFTKGFLEHLEKERKDGKL